jgi:hypothetical protein
MRRRIHVLFLWNFVQHLLKPILRTRERERERERERAEATFVVNAFNTLGPSDNE